MTDISAQRPEQVVVCKWNPELIGSLLDSGLDVYVVLDDFDVDHMHPDWELLGRAARVYRVSEFDSLEEISAVAADLSLRGVSGDRIISFTEFSQFGAGYLAILLGGQGDPLRHVAYRDKRLMKQRVAAAGVRTAAWASLPDPNDQQDVAAVCERLAFPLVVKPVSGGGAIGTFTVHSPDELASKLAAIGPIPIVKSRQLIAEEFVTGRELHIDAVWDGDEPLFLVVSAYFMTRLTVLEGIAHIPEAGLPLDGSTVINAEDDPELYRRVLDLHRQVNRALGIERAVTHLEVFQRPDGELVFSEIATRLGGGWIPPLLGEATGLEVHHALGQALVTGKLPAPRPSRRHLGALHLRPAAPGRITAIPSVETMLAMDGVLRAQPLRGVGDVVDLSHASEWCVFVVLGADTADEFDALVERVGREFRVEVGPVE
ncbi:ATP-grasp domain-containing protein [Streptacidiphilus sp. PB12-B1b]|uniref:ATP-grasp domain-containing protein n=1 Tax=Streptacidiphilus sp. PB12-B1b TaxID=2705012 RepID=UPI0015FA2EF0|nr:ATP-grasp domain-containing protein [Streptacidiphilus sp. PB12-B1b]QMU75407.1 ATP-grasp domain-containing protein [Streptacidiphilus sp. PB12-B1b]